MVKQSNEKPRRYFSLPEDTSGSLSSLGSFSNSNSSINNTNNNNVRNVGYSPKKSMSRQFKIFDDPAVTRGYESVPLIEVDPLPRGGISLETKAVGRIQFGIPPETIKDSMLMGMEVPQVYIVPVERFCREMGPVLGINMAEFEFPAYFNYFVRQKRCTLIVDSIDAEKDIRSVFEETLLGPSRFRDHQSPCANVDEDFDPTFPKDARPNFYKEFYNFRTAEKSTNFEELSVSALLEFVHFDPPARHHSEGGSERIGVPPTPPECLIETAHSSATRVSDGMFADTRKLYGLGGDEMFLDVPAEDRPKLHRHHSDDSDSLSRSNHNRSMTRRNSFGSSEKSPLRVEARRGSISAIGVDSFRGSSSGSLLPDKESNAFSGRRDSLLSVGSALSSFSGRPSRSSSFYASANSLLYADDFLADDGPEMQERTTWMYSQPKWLGELATVYPTNATDEEKKSNQTARVEIFKMAGGTEYIIHDIDENNIIIGKARISGTVRVPDELSLEGFMSSESPRAEDTSQIFDSNNDFSPVAYRPKTVAPTFHPPSFGVTVLGNSHGFDKNGSTSGYVLWVNGRGIMIDPPPYSSATLEREGIRPQMIMAIIITHCHADHDAGTFQKVMTGSRVAIITTPTIYQSFIRKYSALSGLRATLLRHSHRHRPAIIGQPLRFQGAVFHFTYTLHTIPCISFKVEWRGKSIVFTGDHMNIPTAIDDLEQKGVLLKSRADDLRRLPIQDCDVLLHEAGAPPIHTPLSVLEALPEKVKERLYVVHTAAIPPDSDLRVAPTGTAGTIRLDEGSKGGVKNELLMDTSAGDIKGPSSSDQVVDSSKTFQDGKNQNLTVVGDYDASIAQTLMKQFDGKEGREKVAPLVFLRPTDVSDAWFMLNLLSAVPFLSSLSYAHTMEILEIAQVEMYSAGQVVLKGSRRPEFLCVFWEGTCIAKQVHEIETSFGEDTTVWHAGDWTGPVSLQPDISRSAHVEPGMELGDIVALSEEGVKVIVLKMKDMVRILRAGSKLFRKYATLMEDKEELRDQAASTNLRYSLQDSVVEGSSDSLQVIECNSVLRSLTAMQKRYLESLAEGPRQFASLTPIWKAGDPVDYAYLIVSGTATIGKKATPMMNMGRMSRRGSTGAISMSALAAIQESENNPLSRDRSLGSTSMADIDSDKLLKNVHPNSEYAKLELGLRLRSEEMDEPDEAAGSLSDQAKRRADIVQAHRDKFANKVLARLYSRKAYTEHLIFSRGNFLSDTSKMVSGDLANISSPMDVSLRSSFTGSAAGPDHHYHTSNLLAGPQGCVVMVFPRSTLVPFLDSNPGVLLCLLGTQVVV